MNAKVIPGLRNCLILVAIGLAAIVLGAESNVGAAARGEEFADAFLIPTPRVAGPGR